MRGISRGGWRTSAAGSTAFVMLSTRSASLRPRCASRICADGAFAGLRGAARGAPRSAPRTRCSLEGALYASHRDHAVVAQAGVVQCVDTVGEQHDLAPDDDAEAEGE